MTRLVNENPRPVFLLAPARSYSTVALAMLAGHPGLYGFPELILFNADTVAELLASVLPRPDFPRSWAIGRLSGLCRAIAEVHDGEQNNAAMRRAHEWLTQRPEWTTRQLLDHLLAGVAPREGLEKSPDTVDNDAALQRCLQSYPHARFLHLTRHPESTQRSMRKHWEVLYRDRPAQELAVNCAAAWYYCHRRILDGLRSVPASRQLRVRAEDLLREPATWLPRVLDWLELDKDDAIVHGMLDTSQWRFAGRGPDGWLAGGDPTFLAAPALRPIAEPPPVTAETVLGPPGGVPADDMRDMARYLGY
jgi:hypothetical protein